MAQAAESVTARSSRGSEREAGAEWGNGGRLRWGRGGCAGKLVEETSKRRESTPWSASESLIQVTGMGRVPYQCCGVRPGQGQDAFPASPRAGAFQVESDPFPGCLRRGCAAAAGRHATMRVRP